MNEKKETLAQQQKRLRPKFEDMAKECLSGERLHGALSFAAFLKENGMAIQYNALNSWRVAYKGKRGICGLRLSVVEYGEILEAGKDSWSIEIGADDEAFENLVAEDEKLKELIWRNVKHCHDCHPHCDINKIRSIKKKILGKEFVGVCKSMTWFSMKNPGNDDIEFAKVIAETRKERLKHPCTC